MATTTKATARPRTTATKAAPSKTAPPRKPAQAAPARAGKPQARAIVTGEITPDMRRQMIAEAAYLRAEQRGFGAGDPAEDWLAAEREVDRLLNDRAAPITQ